MNKWLDWHRYAAHGFSMGNRYLGGVAERLFFTQSESQLRYAPIFVLGAPRSGSTLAIQVITDAFDVGYISNRHCTWFGAPAIAEHWLRPLAKKPDSDYKSEHGETHGDYAPAECGDWWYRFFRSRPPYVTLKETDPKRMREFRHSVGTLAKAFGKPVLFKNLYASLRIQAIAHYIPESLFIIVHRDEVDNAHSLLETRMKVYGKYDTWWSMEPPQAEKLKALPVHEQVIEQIRHIHTTISQDLKNASVSTERVFNLHYEAFCEDTHAILDALGTFFDANNCQVNRIGTPPRQFVRRTNIRIDQELYEKMRNYAGDI